jgi:hypothetical protein
VRPVLTFVQLNRNFKVLAPTFGLPPEGGGKEGKWRPSLELVGGRVRLGKVKGRKGWFFRIYVPSRRGYILRVLKGAITLEDASIQAVEEWSKLREVEKATGSPLGTLVTSCISGWVQSQQLRFDSGELSSSALQNKKGLFEGHVSRFIRYKRWIYVSDISIDGWSDYRLWRREHGWKLTKASQPPSDQTLNAEVYRIREWYSNYLLPKRLVSFVPTLKTVRIDEETRDQSNPPFSPEDYRTMYLWLEQWSQKGRRQEFEERGTRTLNPYWRMCFRHYFLIACNTGCRPSELIERLRWSDVEIEELSPGRIISIILIRKSKTGNKREIVSNAGKYFLRWKQWIDEYRKEHEFRPIEKEDLVFCNPKTDERYTVTLYSRYFRKMRDELRLDKNYTLYSSRSYFVNEGIRQGRDPFDLATMTGHNLETARRHYVRSQIRHKKDELTKRNWTPSIQQDTKDFLGF